MAVQAQYPSNVLFNRSEQERKEMDYSQQPPGFLDQPPLLFATNGVNGNQRKRGRESSGAAAAAAAAFQMVPTPQMNLFSPSIQSPALITLAQLQNQTPPPPPPPSLVSTGLRLSFEDSNQTQNQSQSQTHSQSNPFVHQDLVSLINHQKDEIEQYLIAQGEQLRRTLAERRQKHYRALLAAAEESAARRLREKDLELDWAIRRTAELEDRIARLRTESLTWQAKAMSDQAAAASLHAQIQQARLAAAAAANNRPNECCGESSAAEDAESAHVDPDRVEDWRRVCRVCRVSAVSVVMLPCRHLCLCSACDAAVADSDAACCPVCHAVRTGRVQVFLS